MVDLINDLNVLQKWYTFVDIQYEKYVSTVAM